MPRALAPLLLAWNAVRRGMTQAPSAAVATGVAPDPVDIPYTWINRPVVRRPTTAQTKAQVAQTDGATAFASAAAGIVDQYGVNTFTATLDTAVNADAPNLASFVTTYESTPRPRQPSLSFHLTIRTDDECLKILSVALGTRVRITGAPATWPAGAVTFVVEGIQHTIGIDSRIVEWMTSAPVGLSPAIADSFSRTNPSAFGSPDFGPDWTTNGAGVSVGSGVGIHTHSATGVAQETLIGAGIRDSEQRVSITVAAVAATQTVNVRIVARHYDSSNYWLLKMEFATDGTVDLLLNKVLADTSTFPTGGQAFNVDTYSAGSVVHAKFRVAGDTFSAKAWSGVLAAEPSSWDFTYTEAVSGIPNGSVGLVSDLAVGNTNTLPFLVTFDDYQVTTGTNPQGVPGPWFRWDESYWDGPDDVRPF